MMRSVLYVCAGGLAAAMAVAGESQAAFIGSPLEVRTVSTTGNVPLGPDGALITLENFNNISINPAVGKASLSDQSGNSIMNSGLVVNTNGISSGAVNINQNRLFGAQPWINPQNMPGWGFGPAFTGGPDPTTFLATGGNDANNTFSINIQLPVGLTRPLNNYFGFLWGSLDATNEVVINYINPMFGAPGQFRILGSDVVAGAGMGSQGEGGTYWVDFVGGMLITSVSFFGTAGDYFEFDNVAFGCYDLQGVSCLPFMSPPAIPSVGFTASSAIPEPASMLALGAGLLGLGLIRRRT